MERSAVWIVLLAGGIVLLLKLRARTARRLIALASVVLLLVQGVTFGVVTYRHLTSDASRSREESSYVLNGREQFNVSAEGNLKKRQSLCSVYRTKAYCP